MPADCAPFQQNPGRFGGDRVRPVVSNDNNDDEFVELQRTRAGSPKSWSAEAATIDPTTFDLSVKNHSGGEEVTHRSPDDIMDEVTGLYSENAQVLTTIWSLL